MANDIDSGVVGFANAIIVATNASMEGFAEMPFMPWRSALTLLHPSIQCFTLWLHAQTSIEAAFMDCCPYLKILLLLSTWPCMLKSGLKGKRRAIAQGLYLRAVDM
ncbi:hypothetical protein KBY97_10940 [Synechococcus sp. ATX 2A4]|uniref:hypothetical protein n=1 Tax=Synechococcus sp. ATX 2A4 TaxID=2823727 RepID=UPI0020CD9F1E|nr:hypothetical protein [Synechococcus sp. ATX 2A4]MCP9885634.1 hypothetical protein [Synechococcus sp. ATX 2A4]